MKFYAQLFAKWFSSPILMDTRTRDPFLSELLGRMDQVLVAEDAGVPPEPLTRSQAAEARMNAIMETYGDVVILHINGVIDKGMTDDELYWYGGTDLDDVNNALSAIEGDERLTRLVMAMNTPGGSAIGVDETSQRLAQMRDRFEIHAHIGVQCCSAGYYLASQADRIACAPSAITGSIGVYMALLDQTKYLDQLGLKVNLIKAGRLKAMGAGFKELTDEERAIFQKGVDKIYARFTAACTSLREISSESMQGQCFDGEDAMAAKLVDVLTTDTMDEYVSRLLSE